MYGGFMKTTKDSRTAFLSTILGDGWITKTGNAEIKHCAAQKDYLEWKRNYLTSQGVPCGDIKYKLNNGFDSYTLYIKTTRYGKLYRKIIYKSHSRWSCRDLCRLWDQTH